MNLDKLNLKKIMNHFKDHHTLKVYTFVICNENWL